MRGGYSTGLSRDDSRASRLATLEQYRRQGISAAAGSLVCRAIRETGRTPVWSCGEDNWASLRVAQKLGFTPIGRRVYLIPSADRLR